jgi:ABC-type glycerol-3-phosphate transport system permease component
MGGSALIHAATILFVAFLLLPIYQMVTTAVKPSTQAWQLPPTLVPHSFTLEHFITMWEIVPRLPMYLGNSLIYGLGVSLISLAIAIPSAYGLTRFRLKIRGPVLAALIYGNMFAPIMLLVPLQETMRLIGLTNTYPGMIVAGTLFTTPFSTWLFVAYFHTIPVEIDESGLVDGARRVTILLRLVLPLLGPAIIAVAIYAFITGWSQQFQLALVLIQNDILMPVTQGLYQFFSRSSVRWTELMAAAFVTSLIPFLLFFSIQRHLVSGMTAGSVVE